MLMDPYVILWTFANSFMDRTPDSRALIIMSISSLSSICEQVLKFMVRKVDAEGCKRSNVLALEVMAMLPASARISSFSSGVRAVLCEKGDTKQRKGVTQHSAHLAGSSSTVVLGANRPQTARALSGTVVRGGGGEGAGQGGDGAKTQRGKDGGNNNTTARGRGSSIQEQKLENYFSKRPRKKDGDEDGGV
jgi:hypothetical protein